MKEEKGRFKLVVFDCDGVIFDSIEANRRFYNAVLARMGRAELTPEDLVRVHMYTTDDAVRYLFRDEQDMYLQAIQYARSMGYADFIPYMRFEPGVPETLDALRPMVRTAILTNRSNTMPRLREEFGLDRWFDLIVCAMDVARPKPEPEGMYRILDELGVSGKDTVYVGDSRIDEEVSERTGIPLIAYKNRSLKAVFHVEHFRDILEIVRQGM